MLSWPLDHVTGKLPACSLLPTIDQTVENGMEAEPNDTPAVIDRMKPAASRRIRMERLRRIFGS